MWVISLFVILWRPELVPQRRCMWSCVCWHMVGVPCPCKLQLQYLAYGAALSLVTVMSPGQCFHSSLFKDCLVFAGFIGASTNSWPLPNGDEIDYFLPGPVGAVLAHDVRWGAIVEKGWMGVEIWLSDIVGDGGFEGVSDRWTFLVVWYLHSWLYGWMDTYRLQYCFWVGGGQEMFGRLPCRAINGWELCSVLGQNISRSYPTNLFGVSPGMVAKDI